MDCFAAKLLCIEKGMDLAIANTSRKHNLLEMTVNEGGKHFGIIRKLEMYVQADGKDWILSLRWKCKASFKALLVLAFSVSLEPGHDFDMVI